MVNINFNGIAVLDDLRDLHEVKKKWSICIFVNEENIVNIYRFLICGPVFSMLIYT